MAKQLHRSHRAKRRREADLSRACGGKDARLCDQIDASADSARLTIVETVMECAKPSNGSPMS